jgi:small subunit ribosomal protein S4
MARFRGPRLKVVRRFGQHLPGLTRKSAENRPYPPGQHGLGRRPKPSDYRIRLEEKQKLRMNYGLSERQLRKYFRAAVALKGDTGQSLLQMLESRLDNVVFRAGYAPTIPSARQLVQHGHITVNGKRVDIPSYILQANDVLGIKEKSKAIPTVAESFPAPTLEVPSYLSREEAKMEVTFAGAPTRDDIPLDIQENLIIEHYSRVA